MMKRKNKGYVVGLVCSKGRMVLCGHEAPSRISADVGFADMVAETVCEVVEGKDLEAQWVFEGEEKGEDDGVVVLG